MTDIFIKSFNRPFYLERCLSSIHDLVAGEYKITVLDDGTPARYLQRIKEKFPNIEIITSEAYQKKTLAIQKNLETGEEINGFEIPTDLWINAAKNASPYFIMTEDDVWFTEKINIDELTNSCKNLDINLLKLGWLGNMKDDENIDIESSTATINSTVPKGLVLGGQQFMEAFILNKFKFFTILYRLGLVDNFTKRKYWALNSILMGLYKKEYWLQIWKGMSGKVDEKRQLINAAVYYNQRKKNKNFISRLKREAMKTTFQSSATNSYHKYGEDFDVNLFNYQINEAWYRGDFDAMQNFPNDFSIDYFIKFLDHKIDIEAYKSWVNKFKNQYKNLGCNVD